jgi:hypothetical protein
MGTGNRFLVPQQAGRNKKTKLSFESSIGMMLLPNLINTLILMHNAARSNRKLLIGPLIKGKKTKQNCIRKTSMKIYLKT